jgi:thioredoxin-like negative regulator of GroEL
MEAQTEMKQATAVAAMKKGKWDQAESFRDVIKDKEQAQTLEQQERIGARDKATLLSLIGAAEKALAEKATAANHKKLADLYRQNRDNEKALQHYNAVVEKTGAMDPAIDAAITAVLCQRFDDAIAQWRTYGEQDASRREDAERKIALIEQQKADTLLTRLKERVERYPNDANYRFELAEQYWERRDTDAALREFQLAQKSPQLKKRAQVYMGKCLTEKGLADLAIEQYLAVVREPGPMDADRKDCLYCLAETYEKAGRADEALKCLKEIFSADVNYRDVSARISKYYQAST